MIGMFFAKDKGPPRVTRTSNTSKTKRFREYYEHSSMFSCCHDLPFFFCCWWMQQPGRVCTDISQAKNFEGGFRRDDGPLQLDPRHGHSWSRADSGLQAISVRF